MTIHDPGRLLVGGNPRDVIVPARIARALDRALLDDYRRRTRGMDAELDATLTALHLSGLEWAEHRSTSANGKTELPASDSPPSCTYEDLDVATVAHRLGCSDRHVRGLCARGQLAGRKISGRWMVAPEALDGYLSDHAA
jgi:hypothetical protein